MSKLPAPGTAYLIKVDATRNTFCWVTGVVLSRSHSKLGTVEERGYACATWLASGVPTAADLAGAQVAYVDHDNQPRRPLILLDFAVPPARFKVIGSVPPAIVDASHALALSIENHWYSGIKGLAYEVERQWKWDHERDRIAADDAAFRAKVEAKNAAEAAVLATRVAKRQKATLTTIGRVELLPEWEGLTTKKRREKAEALLRDLIASLRKLGASAKRPAKLAAIKAAVEAINEWSGSSAIDTPEREALATAIDDIAHAAGLRGHDLAGPWRDW